MTKREMFAWIIIAALVAGAASRGMNYIYHNSGAGAVAVGTATDDASRQLVGEGYMQPPVCPASLVGLEFGAICRQPSTGKVLVRGIVEIIP